MGGGGEMAVFNVLDTPDASSFSESKLIYTGLHSAITIN